MEKQHKTLKINLDEIQIEDAASSRILMQFDCRMLGNAGKLATGLINRRTWCLWRHFGSVVVYRPHTLRLDQGTCIDTTGRKHPTATSLCTEGHILKRLKEWYIWHSNMATCYKHTWNSEYSDFIWSMLKRQKPLKAFQSFTNSVLGAPVQNLAILGVGHDISPQPLGDFRSKIKRIEMLFWRETLNLGKKNTVFVGEFTHWIFQRTPGCWFQPLWKIWKSMRRMTSHIYIYIYIMENKKCLKPPTRHPSKSSLH